MRSTLARALAPAVVLAVVAVLAAVTETWWVAVASLALLHVATVALLLGPGRASGGTADAGRLGELESRLEVLGTRVVDGTAETRGEILALREELALQRGPSSSREEAGGAEPHR